MNLLCWAMAPSSRVTRKWEVFAGRNKFYCDGFLMSAPHTGVFYFTVFLITFTSTLFFAFDCPFLADRITLAIPIIGGCLFLFTMGALLRTTFTDPGIIPRASQDEAAYIEKQIEVPNSLNSPTFRPPPRTKEVLVKGQTVKLKYCFTCKIFRPPRASHCSLCDNCVDRFDHHCPWVGNCVGKRNYRFFYMFIVSLAFLAVFIFSCSLTHLILLAKDEEKQEFVEVIRQAPFSLVSSFICFMSIWSVIGLAGFHTYLTTSDQTTNEDIKGSFSSKGGAHNVNPYSHGNICFNCFYIICGPMTPSLIDRRGIVTDEYRVQMQQAERFNTPTLHVPIIAQPVTANEQSNKINYYDIESGPPTLLSSGVYRQRSYDNLHNGNSASVDQLIENELPLSAHHSPVAESATTANDLQQRSTTIMSASDEHLHAAQLDALDEDVDDANMDSMSNQNHLSGSYSNLFRADKLNDEAAEEVDPATELPPSAAIGDIDAAALALPRENVYSNVPFVGTPSMLMQQQQSPERPNPSMHVYSNVVNATAAAAATSTATALHDFSFGGVSAILTTNGPSPPMSDDSLQITRFDRQSSSTMLADDLDLDDPVTVAGTFGQTPSRKHRTSESGQVVGSSTTNVHSVAISQAATSAKKTGGNAMEMTNVIPQVNVLGAAEAANASFCSPSRMRLLHDTTMIDTALDLDSLDGSSMGNTSQACLVKTAIV